LGDSTVSATVIHQFTDNGYYRFRVLLGAAVLCGALGMLAPDTQIQLVFVTIGFSVSLLTTALWGMAWQGKRKRQHRLAILAEFIDQDTIPSFVVSTDGLVESTNRAGQSTFAPSDGETLTRMLSKTFANPGGILFRLREKAELAGSAQETIFTRQGNMRLSVHRIDTDAWLWRLEQRLEVDAIKGGETASLPMLITGRRGVILFLNEAARMLVGKRLRTLADAFPETDPENGQLVTLVTQKGNVPTRVAVLDAGVGRTAIYLIPVEGLGNSKGETVNSDQFEELPVPLLRMSIDGKIQSFNPAAFVFVGDALHEGVQLADLMEGLGRPLVDWLAETATGRAVQHSEFLRLKRKDKEIFVQVALTRVVDDDTTSIVAVLTDATQLKTLENQFVQSQKMQAIGQLAGGIAHDFNNFLTAISGHCDLLLLRHDQGDADYSDLVQINQNSNRAAALVGQLLAFSRKQTLRPEIVDMRDTLADLTHLLNRLVGEKVNLTLGHDPILKSIRADKRQLEQVLMNLVVNARDAMPKGGEIRIETESRTITDPTKHERVTVPAGEYVIVRVLDQGTGISPDMLQKVFEPFFTTKRTGDGTGLGLSTAYGIVKQSGGYIFVDSKLGEGTCFTLLFPVADKITITSAPEAAPKKDMSANFGEGVVLLVEDEAPVRAFASRALRLRGYTVLEADSAESTLKILEDEGLAVDLFVTDVVMPGKDGPSWVKEALVMRANVRVVFVSGYAEDKFDDTTNVISNAVFLPKPFSLNDLTDTVHQQLN